MKPVFCIHYVPLSPPECRCSASVVEESFEYLDAPIERITGADVPMPYAASLEKMALPQVSIMGAGFTSTWG